MVCGTHTRLVRPGQCFSTNKWNFGGHIPIRSGVRQGCPLSVALYALCLHPLIQALEDSLPCIKIGRNSQHGPVIAYADDVTVFVTNPKDFQVIQQVIQLYERATGAQLNSNKSKALAIGAWTEPPTNLDIHFHERVNILVVEFRPTIATSIRDSWTKVICAVGAQARRAYTRHLFGTANEIRTAVPPREDMACFTDLPTPTRTGTTPHDHLLLAPMAGGNL